MQMDIQINIDNEFFKEEERNDYLISTSMKKVWAVELDLLSKLLSVCKKHDLKVYSCAGTILGAIRHGGYIPWDDDIDMMMYREDYEKLCEISKEEFVDPYFFQTEFSDIGSARGHAQLRNSHSTAILSTEKGKKAKFNQGIFIDIFPLDNLPDDEHAREKFLSDEKRRLRHSRWMLNGAATNETLYKRAIKRLAYSLNKIIPFGRWMYNRFEREAKKYNGTNSEEVGIILFGEERFIWEKKYIQDVIWKRFEMLMIPVPKGYDYLLKKTYGEWETPVKGNSVHGDVFFDPDRPYTYYLNKSK